MSSIFLSYRRQDAPGHAGRIYDRLVERFGKDNVYMDLDSTAPGADFGEVIDSVLARCAALIAVIGPNWITAMRRSQRGDPATDPEDWVRREIATALKRDIRVVPVLVQGVQMPDRDELPEDMKGLARRHAVELTDTAWTAQLNLVIDSLAGTLPATDPTGKPWPPRTATARPDPGERRRARRLSATVAALLVCALAVVPVTVVVLARTGERIDGAQVTPPSRLSPGDYRSRLRTICTEHLREAERIKRAEGPRQVYGITLQYEPKTVAKLKALHPPRELEQDHRTIIALWNRRLSLLNYYYEAFRQKQRDAGFRREFLRALRQVDRITYEIQKRFTSLKVTPECNLF
jgi:hypothetical protein